MAQWLLENPGFREQPVDVITFVKDKQYLDMMNPDGSCQVYPAILELIKEVFSGEIKNLRISYNEVIFCAGIGSGKSFFSSICMSYILYMVGCLKNPAAYFNKARGTQIYLMNMSVNEKSAKKVVFGEIKARIDGSEWFENRMPYDKRIGSELRFNKQNLSIIPGNSQESFFEGYNILAGVIDEADAHKKTEDKDFAEVGYDAIKGRIKSRFGVRGLIIIIGSPKTTQGFIMTKMREAEGLKRTLARRMAIWEAHPASEYCGKTFKYKKGVIEIDVPIEYEDDFKRNPEKSLKDLAAIPLYASEPFFSYPEKVLEGFNEETEIPTTFDGKLKQDFKCFDRIKRTVHIDLGINKNGGDACGVAMGHVSKMVKINGEHLPIIKIDLMIRITAKPGSEIIIADVRQFIYKLIDRKFKIFLVTMDGWQSTDSLQQFKKRRLRAELLSIDRTTAPYEATKEAIYDERLDYYEYQPFMDECVKLELVNGDKVDHQPKGSKDVSDAVAGVVHNLLTNMRVASGMSAWKTRFGSERTVKTVITG